MTRPQSELLEIAYQFVTGEEWMMSEARTAKEEIYDNQISPIMRQILAICQEHKIAVLAEFCLGYDEDADDELCCTSALLTEDHEPTERILKAFDLLKPRPSFIAFAITTKK